MNKAFVILAMIAASASKGLCQSKNFIDQPFIEVNGSYDSLVVPDKIYIKIVISERDNKDKIPLSEIENKMITALKSLNINTEKNLETSDMISSFDYHLLKKKDIIKSKEYTLLAGFKCRNSK